MQEIYNEYLDLYFGKLVVNLDNPDVIRWGNDDCFSVIEYNRSRNELWVNTKHADSFFNYFGLVEHYDYHYLFNWIILNYDVPHRAIYMILPF